MNPMNPIAMIGPVVDRFLDRYFGPDFRWAEFCASVGAAYGSGVALARTLNLDVHKGQYIGLFGAVVGGFYYIRNPKKLDWVSSPTAPVVAPVAPIPSASPQAEEPAPETQDQAGDQTGDQTGDQSDGSASS